MHVNKEFEKNLLTIYVNVTGEPVQDPQAYISWLFYITNALA